MLKYIWLQLNFLFLLFFISSNKGIIRYQSSSKMLFNAYGSITDICRQLNYCKRNFSFWSAGFEKTGKKGNFLLEKIQFLINNCDSQTFNPFKYRFINSHWNQLKGFLSSAISHTDLYERIEGKTLKRTFSLLKLAINLSWLPRHCMAAHARFSHPTISVLLASVLSIT